ncbi:MAG: 16S rRNA (cytidine(1402)-2'-O)-methyltransferase [Leptospiraceae bacterium]|nr:16S rRNA (cytidine(1402)-2'-O)-methyltransferase [Leptospiraceae bacterium]
MSGKLFIVATPIGNLEDITLRAIRILKESDLILCENSKNSAKLLDHYEIKTNRMSLFTRSSGKDFDWIIEKLEKGENISYISDAGSPGVSDPGSNLVRKVRNSDFEVISIPGPSALTSMISICGVQANPCFFLGFLPEKKVGKEKELRKYLEQECIIVLYESVHRIRKTMEIIGEIFVESEIFIGRELTKLYEEVIVWKPKNPIPKIVEKGEFVVLINNHLKKIAKDGIKHTDI